MQKVITGENTASKSWRQQLKEFIKEKGGSYQDKKWQLEYFEEYKVIGLGNDTKKTSNGVGAFTNKLGSDKIVNAMNKNDE